MAQFDEMIATMKTTDPKRTDRLSAIVFSKSIAYRQKLCYNLPITKEMRGASS